MTILRGHSKVSPIVAVIILGFAAVAAEGATTEEILAALKPVKAARDGEKMYFEMSLLGSLVGCGRHSLTVLSDQEGGGYHYDVEANIVMPNGARINAAITSKLSTRFEPRQIEMRRSITLPDGKTESTIQTVRIDAETMILKKGKQGGKLTEKKMPGPKRPFVFAMEFLVQRIDLKKYPTFSLRELDPEEGTIATHRFRTKRRDDGSVELSSTKEKSNTGLRFVFDSKGKMVSAEEPPVPLVSKRCSAERAEEIRKSLKKK